MTDGDAHQYLASFMEVCLAAVKRQVLSPGDYLALVNPRGLAVPLLTSLCPPVRQAGLDVYLRQLVSASEEGVLPLESLHRLLLARSNGNQPDIAGVSEGAKRLLLRTVDDLQVKQLIDARQADQWKQEISLAAGKPGMPRA
jgi:hypothetical protein